MSLSPTTKEKTSTSINPASPQTQTQQQGKKNVSLCLPIVYGSIAFYLGKKADEYATHTWTLYVRGPTGEEDLSPAISKVVFQLHPSFPQPIREITEPPYEVTEKGWGEFEASIRIVWQDVQERPTVLTHGIKLYPPGLPSQITAQNVSSQLQSDEPVLAERYDEVVFTDPSHHYFQQLQRMQQIPTLTQEHSYNSNCLPHFRKSNFSDDVLVERLLTAHKFLEEEVRNIKDRILKADEEKLTLEKEIVEATTQAQAATSQAKSAKGSSSTKGITAASSKKKKTQVNPISAVGATKKAKISIPPHNTTQPVQLTTLNPQAK